MAWRRARPSKSGLGQQPTGTLGRKPKRPKTLKEAVIIAKAKAKKKAAETQTKRLPLPTGLVAAPIKRKIEKLRKKEKWSFRRRHTRTDFYAYLNAVYRVQDWRDERESERWAQKVAAMYEIKGRKNKSPIHTIIDASSKQVRYVKSRWAIAIEYAVAKNVRKADFVEFLEKNGGPQGCARKMAALKKDTAKPRKITTAGSVFITGRVLSRPSRGEANK
jgi:hypothetical protein